MDRKQVEDKIQATLKERRGKVVARHTISALFGAVADPVGTIGKLFFGAKDAIDQDKHQVEQEIILDLLCKMDDDLAEAAKKAKSELPKDKIVVLGEIVASGKDVDEVTGVSISEEAGPVEFKPGTKITASGEKAKKVTGLKVGGKDKEDPK